MTSKRRRGRLRKSGPRHRNGHLKALREPADSPRAIAQRMPHRRGLGDQVLDQRAETELGRMVLRGELEDVLATAGETYAALWRGYVSTLNGPRWPWRGQGRDLACDGCPVPETRKFCVCDHRRRIWQEVTKVLWEASGGDRLSGGLIAGMVHKVAVGDETLHGFVSSIEILRLGLSALAQHFGLTRKGKQAYQNALSQIASA